MAADDDLPWTTTRCNRLLRPLSSKLAKLRKEATQPRSAGRESRGSSNTFAPKASPRRTSNFSQPARKPRGVDKARDPDWVPDAKPGGPNRKTYGGSRGKRSMGIHPLHSGTSNARPGEIAFTPLVARTGGRYQESPQLQYSPLRQRGKNRGPLVAKVEQLQRLKKRMPTDVGNLIKGLSEAYANLLQATAATENKSWKGTRSLFGACLRKVPEYIELEEHFAELDQEDADEDEDRDISQEIYMHLEAQYETRSGQGWRSFKQIVRAHGTSLLCDAFADQILGLETLHLLVSHCLNVSAWDEAEKFLLAYPSNLKPLPGPNNPLADLFDDERSPYMGMLKDFVDRTGRYRFLYDQLEYMISQELLPLEWLATACMRPIWDRLVRTLAEGDHRTTQNAYRFLETAICAGIGLPDESLFEDGEVDIVSKQLKPSSRDGLRKALDTTFSSLLTVLCSIALVNRSREDPAGEHAVQRVTWVLDSVVVGLLKRNDIRDDLDLLGPIAENMQTFAQRAIWTVFASFLVHLEGCRTSPSLISLSIPTLVHGLNWVTQQYFSTRIDISAILSTLPEFISSTARGTGRIWKDDGFDQLQRLVQALLSLSGLRLPHQLWTLKRLALEAAMEFAHSTSDARHMAYARDIEKTMRMKGRVVIMQSPAKDDSPSTSTGGFKWEEGIGEWVACTPFPKQSVKRPGAKSVRTLELLPTPTPSDYGGNGGEEEDLPTTRANDAPWQIDIPDSDDDEHTFPQSSPVKKAPRTSTSSLGKCSCASSPKVVIPVKRTRLSTPDSPIKFYPTLPVSRAVSEDADAPRRSRRSRNEIKGLLNGLRTQRPRSSLDKGLRNLERKAYEEPKIVDIDLQYSDSEAEASGPDQDTSTTSLSFTSSSSRRNRITTSEVRPSTRSSLGKRGRPRKAVGVDDGDDRDELSKTPALQRRSSGRKRVKVVREWWKVGGRAEGEASEDELSFQ